jgi:hypothetical protein
VNAGTCRPVVAFDTETALIRPALLAPPLVVVTWQRPGLDPRIIHHTQAESTLREWLESDAVIVGHNVAYDMAVIGQRFPALMPLIFKAYEDDRVTCTQIRQQLLDIAGGIYRGRHVGKGVYVREEYTLERLAKRCAGIELQKDAWRMSYAEFIDVPLTRWTARAIEVQAMARVRLALLEARQVSRDEQKAHQKEIDGLRSMIDSPPDQCLRYPLEDARATLAVYQAQEKHAHPWLADQFRQSYAYFCLHLSSAWGLRTDSEGVEVLRKEVSEQLAEVEEHLKEIGLVRADGTRDTKAAKLRMIEICRREKIEIPRTDAHDAFKGKPLEAFAEIAAAKKCKAADGSVPRSVDECVEHVCLDEDACTRSEDDVLKEYAELSTLKKVLSNDVEALAKGVMWPVHTRYGLAETGRTTSSKPNIQNWVRQRKCKRCSGKGEIAA